MVLLQSKKEEIGHHPSLYTNFYCFHLPPSASAIFSRKDLKEVGIHSPWDVGQQLVEIFETKNKQKELAESLKSFLQGRKQSTDL